MLGAQLLYKFERPQYAQMKKNHEASTTEGDDVGLSSVYGSIHLLRLFVKVLHSEMSPLYPPLSLLRLFFLFLLLLFLFSQHKSFPLSFNNEFSLFLACFFLLHLRLWWLFLLSSR